jgi:hypothetical protein
LLLIELILPRLVHQIRQRAKINAARLDSAGRADSAKLIGNAVCAGADKSCSPAGSEILHVRAEAEATPHRTSASWRAGVAVG